MRVLLPLVWAPSFAAALLAGLLYGLVFAGSANLHRFPWRELFFASVLFTLAAVTGIKTRRGDVESADTA